MPQKLSGNDRFKDYAFNISSFSTLIWYSEEMKTERRPQMLFYNYDLNKIVRRGINNILFVFKAVLYIEYQEGFGEH